MKRKTYPSDITREQFEAIRPLLENASKRTKPRTVDLYEVCVQRSICYAQAANGGPCPTIFPGGKRCTRISPNGVYLMIKE